MHSQPRNTQLVEPLQQELKSPCSNATSRTTAGFYFLLQVWYNGGMRTAAGVILLVVLTAMSLARNTLWMDDGMLWLDTIQKSPHKARGYNELGLYAIKVHDYQLALSAFNRSLQLDPYMPHAYVNIGLAYEGLNRVDLAILAYQRAISLAPEDPIPYYNLGQVYYKTMKDHQKALGFFLKARDLNPLEPDVHQLLGYVYRDMGMDARSMAEFRLYNKLKD